MIDVVTGQARVLARTGEPFLYLTVSPDERWVAGTAETGDVYLWQLPASWPAPSQQVSPLTARLLAGKSEYNKMARAANPFGDGRAAARVRQALEHFCRLRTRRPVEFKPK